MTGPGRRVTVTMSHAADVLRMHAMKAATAEETEKATKRWRSKIKKDGEKTEDRRRDGGEDSERVKLTISEV